MPKSKNVVIRVTPKQAERWRRAAADAGAEHYTSWAREQVDAAVRRSRRNPPPGERREPRASETRAAERGGNRTRGRGRTRPGRDPGKLTASGRHGRESTGRGPEDRMPPSPGNGRSHGPEVQEPRVPGIEESRKNPETKNYPPETQDPETKSQQPAPPAGRPDSSPDQ